MNFIDSNYVKGTAEGYVKDSTGKGNYTGDIAKTGDKEEYSVKNIYDMAGNVWEWTMEAYDTDYRVFRGGYYGSSRDNYPASFRGYGYPDLGYYGIGFRVTLYL